MSLVVLGGLGVSFIIFLSPCSPSRVWLASGPLGGNLLLCLDTPQKDTRGIVDFS